MFDQSVLCWAQPRSHVETLLQTVRKESRYHYVYVLHRPNGEPFYVGKGQNLRVFEHEVEATGTSRRTHKLNVIRSILSQGNRVAYSIHSAFERHEEALSAERRLIAQIGRFDLGKGPLTNQTDGGEGTLNPSEDSKERHRQTLAGTETEDPDRAAANKLFSEFCSVASTPIKPISSYGPQISTLHKNRQFIGKKPRNAGALLVMAVAQGRLIRAGTELSRRFTMEGRELVLENGCGRDMLVNGMIELSDATPKHEKFILTSEGAAYVKSCYEARKLISYGVLDDPSIE